jgi:hypothetical protein
LLSFGAESFVFQYVIQKFKIEIYKALVLPVVVYGCETWPATLRLKRKLRMFENRMLRRTFGPKVDEVTGDWKNYIMRSLMVCTPHPILFR